VDLFAESGSPTGPTGPSSSGLTEAIQKAEQQDLEKLKRVEGWCRELESSIRELKWETRPCEGISWQVSGESVKGRPLVFAEFGDLKSENVTLVISMVHGDEVTPLYLGLKLAEWARDNPASVRGTRVVIAPLVNPDSFYARPRTRTNARGVDVNRNFPTSDWKANAHRLWKGRFRSNPRRYPGKEANSEPETVFQQALIRNIHPTKILSIHAPLNFMDYDGPTTLSLERFPKEYVQQCLKLRSRLKAVTGGFFPGSLGNYAGQEMGIPTFTLELPTAEPTLAERYWQQFRVGVSTMIEFKVPDVAVRHLKPRDGG